VWDVWDVPSSWFLWPSLPYSPSVSKLPLTSRCRLHHLPDKLISIPRTPMQPPPPWPASTSTSSPAPAPLTQGAAQGPEQDPELGTSADIGIAAGSRPESGKHDTASFCPTNTAQTPIGTQWRKPRATQALGWAARGSEDTLLAFAEPGQTRPGSVSSLRFTFHTLFHLSHFARSPSRSCHFSPPLFLACKTTFQPLFIQLITPLFFRLIAPIPWL